MLTDRLQNPSSFLQAVENQVNTMASEKKKVTWELYPREVLREMKGKVIGDIASLSRKEEGIRGVKIENLSHEFCCGKLIC